MHSDEVFWHGKVGGRVIWETLFRCGIMRKVVRREVVAGERLDFFLDSL